MTIHYDDKGKYFTEVITKSETAVTIQTVTHRIEGFVHVRPDSRLKDELDNPETFLAVTDAVLYPVDKKENVYRVKFIAIQRSQIVWVFSSESNEKEEPQA